MIQRQEVLEQVVGLLRFNTPTPVTISSGAIIATSTNIVVDTESAAASDNLDTITFMEGSNAFLVLSVASGARTVVITHNVGNILTTTGSSVTLDETYKFVLAVKIGSSVLVGALAGGGGSVTEAEIQDSAYTYAADAGASDAYAITLTPAVTAYAAGQVFHFKTNTANTGTATLNVNALGAKTIKKQHDRTLATGDIEAGQIVTVVYDGTDFIMQSQVARPSLDPSAIGFSDGSAADDATLSRDVDANANVGLRLGNIPLVLAPYDPSLTGAPDTNDVLAYAKNGLPSVGIKAGSLLVEFVPGAPLGLLMAPGHLGGLAANSASAAPFLSAWGAMAGFTLQALSEARSDEAVGMADELESTANACGIVAPGDYFRADGEWWFQVEFALTQTTNLRFFAGWTNKDLDTMLAADTPGTYNGYGYCYSTNAADTQFKQIKGNGGTAVRGAIVSAPTVAANTKYIARVCWRLQAGGLLASFMQVLNSAGVVLSTTVPTGTPASDATKLRWMCGARSVSAASIKMKIYNAWLLGTVQ